MKLGATTHHDDWHGGSEWVGAQFGQRRQSVQLWHVEIENDDVWSSILRHQQGL